MSASSWLVTCGIITQLRCRLAPLIFLMRDRSLRSMGPNLVKSTLGHGSRPSASPPPPAGALAAAALVLASPAHHGLGEGLHVFLRDAALGAGALHFFERHAEFARELAHRGRRMRQLARGRAVGSCGGKAAVGAARLRRGAGALAAARRAAAVPAPARQRRRCRGRPAAAFDHRDQVADVDLVAQLDLELLEHAGRGRRNLHRRLVGLDGDQRLLGLDRVARLDQHLDHRDILEVADVGHA